MKVFQPVVIVRDFTKTNIPPYYKEKEKEISRLFDNKNAAYECAKDHGEQYKHISDVNFHRVDVKIMEVESKYNSNHDS